MDQPSSVIDVASLEAIAGLQQDGDDDLLKQIIEMYLSHSLSLMQKLDEAVAADNQKAIMETAHTLKSSSAQLGAGRLAKLLQELENMGRGEETTAAPQVLTKVRQEFDAARTALEGFLRARSAR
jgi:HPt (histidine-containing phosphotransfer) domain-containing protein